MRYKQEIKKECGGIERMDTHSNKATNHMLAECSPTPKWKISLFPPFFCSFYFIKQVHFRAESFSKVIQIQYRSWWEGVTETSACAWSVPEAPAVCQKTPLFGWIWNLSCLWIRAGNRLQRNRSNTIFLATSCHHITLRADISHGAHHTEICHFQTEPYKSQRPRVNSRNNG